MCIRSTKVSPVPENSARGQKPANRTGALVVVAPATGDDQQATITPGGAAMRGGSAGPGGIDGEALSASERAPALTLLCLPQIGGGVSTFHTWKGLFGANVRLVAARLPGRESRMREVPYCRAEDAVAELVDALAVDGTQRLALFGHCSGAVVAYALALEIEKRGGPLLEGLYVSSFGPPRAEGSGNGTEVYRLPDAELLHHVEQLDGTPARVMDSPQLMAMVMPKLRADFQIMETYLVPGGSAPLQCPLVLFAAGNDRTLGAAEVAEWARFAARPPTVFQVEGGHFSALPAVGEVLSRLLG